MAGVRKTKKFRAQARALGKAKATAGSLAARGVTQLTYASYKTMTPAQRATARRQGRTIAVDAATRRLGRR